VEPVDPNKEAVFTDSAGEKQSLVNGKKLPKQQLKNTTLKPIPKKRTTLPNPYQLKLLLIKAVK
jgi:hypothetical protein